MAIGTYGTVRPADVNINDIDMYYNYTPNRQSSNDAIFKLNSTDLLSYATLPTDDPNYIDYSTPQAGQNLLSGLFNLRLPATIFSQLGIYTIYIKPKMITVTMVDCGVLSSLPTVKGIVLDVNDLPDNFKANNGLQGYRFDDSGSLMFLQVTPSSSSDVKPNALPYIGIPGTVIQISNTYFNPLVIEVEMVENTLDTIANIVAGEQVKDIQKGILTYYDSDRVITKQFNLYEIKDDVTNVPLYEVKEKRTTIDESQNFDDVTTVG